MSGFIRALAVATLLQIGVIAGLLFWQTDHQLSLSRDYALLVEQRINANLAAEVTHLRRDITAWRLEDQDSMRAYVDKVIHVEHARSNPDLK